MGQKAHPLSSRLGKFLTWESQWFSKNSRVTSHLIFKNYTLKTLIQSFFFNNKILIHSFESRYFNNNLYLTIFTIPVYSTWSAFVKNNLNLDSQSALIERTAFTKDLVKNKIGEVTSSTQQNANSPLFVSLFKNFLKANMLQIKVSSLLFFSFGKLESLAKALLNFTQVQKVIIHFKDLSQFVKLPNIKSSSGTFEDWVYLFTLMNNTKPTAMLIANYLKLILENKSYRKRQRFFLNNLRRFLIQNPALLSKVKGIKIQVKGRLNGRNRSTIYTIQLGSLPLQTLSKEIDYTFVPAFTLYGAFGIKVWIAPIK
uniref:Ribosomal protein S3 n=1 Tax=Heterosigma akashiwo TaxID=2829 RepID=A0A2Z5W7I5_HETAK|nr:ribosomal protein S3 [Heterosigma akashiwo]